MKEQIINRIIKETESTSYLELGYQDGNNFNKIEAEEKVSVDVNGKADYNDGDLDFFENNDKSYDCVFVDSKHEAEHVRQVIKEALKLKPKVVILHDSNPPTKEHQIVPRAQKQFCGDVWKAVVGFIQSYPDVKVETYRSDFGLTVIYPEGKTSRKHFEKIEMEYEEFDKNRVELLNIID